MGQHSSGVWFRPWYRRLHRAGDAISDESFGNPIESWFARSRDQSVDKGIMHIEIMRQDRYVRA